MSNEATLLKEALQKLDYTPTVARQSGEVVQILDGRAGIVENTLAANELGTVLHTGQFTVLKTASIALLEGQQVWWDISASTATNCILGDFPIGVASADSLTGTTVKVELNVKVNALIDLHKDEWTHDAIDGSGTTILPVNEIQLAFDAIVEPAMASILSDVSIPVAEGPIFEAVVAIFDIGDDGALDINFGLANDDHDTDADSITEHAFFHLNGNDLDILLQSADGSATVSAVTTVTDAVDDAYALYQIDARDIDDIQFYVNGVNKLPGTTFLLTDATGPMKALFHIEKTSNDTPAEIRVKECVVRRGLTAVKA